MILEIEREFARRIGNIFIKEHQLRILERYKQIIENDPNYRIIEATEAGQTIGAIGYQPSKQKIDWLFLAKNYYHHPFQTELIEKAINDLISARTGSNEVKIKATLWLPKRLKNSLIAPIMRKYQLSYANRHMMACLLANFNHQGQKGQDVANHNSSNSSNSSNSPHPSYQIENWNGGERDEVAKVISSAYASSVPFKLQPLWKHVTIEGASEQIEELFAGRYGEVSPKYLSLVRYQGKICAVNISTIATPYSGYIVNLAVSPEHQHKGLGTLMLRHSMELFKADGYKWACLSVREGNPAMHLYRRKGFRNRAYVLSIASQ